MTFMKLRILTFIKKNYDFKLRKNKKKLKLKVQYQMQNAKYKKQIAKNKNCQNQLKATCNNQRQQGGLGRFPREIR